MPLTSTIRLRLRAFAGLAVLAFGLRAAAQSNCDQGIVRLPSGVSGSVTICPALAAQVPALQRQLAAILAVQSGQQEQSKELLRLLKNLNSVGRNIGEPRQAELLKTFGARLSADGSPDQHQFTHQLSELADQLESLKDLLLQKLSDQATAQKAHDALQGGVGDAIAHLDIGKADSLLAGIQAQLTVLNSKVDDVHAQTTDIQKTLHQSQEEEARQRQLTQEEAAQAARQASNDPNAFAVISMQAVQHELLIYIGVAAQRTASVLPYSRPTLRIVLRDDRGRASLVKVTDRQTTAPELWRIKPGPFGKQITACFSALDPATGHPREVVTRFSVGEKDRYRTPLNPAGDPIQVPADENSCDGVTEKSSKPLPEPQATASDPMLAAKAQDPFLQDALAHPDHFVMLVFNAYHPQGANAPWHVIVAGGGNSLTDASLQIILRRRGSSRLIDLPVPKVMESMSKGGDVAVPELGEQAIVCFHARREGLPSRMLWRKIYDLQIRPAGNIADFQPASLATLTVDTGQPCL